MIKHTLVVTRSALKKCASVLWLCTSEQFANTAERKYSILFIYMYYALRLYTRVTWTTNRDCCVIARVLSTLFSLYRLDCKADDSRTIHTISADDQETDPLLALLTIPFFSLFFLCKPDEPVSRAILMHETPARIGNAKEISRDCTTEYVTRVNLFSRLTDEGKVLMHISIRFLPLPMIVCTTLQFGWVVIVFYCCISLLIDVFVLKLEMRVIRWCSVQQLDLDGWSTEFCFYDIAWMWI